MKKAKLISLIFGLLSNVSIFAQTSITENGVKYSYNPYDFHMDGLLVENLALQNLNILDVIVVPSEDPDELLPDPIRDGEVAVIINTTGNLVISNRKKVYNVTDWTLTGSADIVLESPQVNDEKVQNEIGSNMKKFSLDESGDYVISGDEEKYYWVIYHIAKKYQADNNIETMFERGSEALAKNITKDYNERDISEDAFYYIEDGKYYIVSFDYAFDADDGENFSCELSNCFITYDSSSITKDIENSNDVTFNFTIGSSIASFSSDAFLNCKIGSFTVNTNNPSFCTICDGMVLCRKENNEPVEVICVAHNDEIADVADQSVRLELPASVKSIADNACKNIYTHSVTKQIKDWETQELKDTTYVTGVRFYTPIYVDFLEESKLDAEGNVIVHFDHPAVNYLNKNISGDIPEYVKLSSKGKNAYYFEVASKKSVITPGDLQRDFIDNISNYAGLCYIDFTKCTAVQTDDKTFSEIDLSGVNNNCLLFLPYPATSNATNVVCQQEDGTFVCENLSLTRANGVPFYSPYEFKAKNISIDYTIGSSLVGLVLPFDYANESVHLATFKDVDSEGYINLSVKETIPANTPFISQLKKGQTTTNISASSAEGIVVKPTVVEPSECPNNSGWTYSGTYRTITNNTSSSYKVYGFASGQLKGVTNGVSSFKPFTGYFVEAPAAVSLAGVRNNIDEIVTNVEFVDVDDMTVVVSSEKMTINGKGSVIVSSVNGSTLYNGDINGSMSVDVQPGIYVVNGKKVIVK